VTPVVAVWQAEAAWRRLSDYLVLTKPRVVAMVLVTTAVCFHPPHYPRARGVGNRLRARLHASSLAGLGSYRPGPSEEDFRGGPGRVGWPPLGRHTRRIGAVSVYLLLGRDDCAVGRTVTGLAARASAARSSAREPSASKASL